MVCRHPHDIPNTDLCVHVGDITAIGPASATLLIPHRSVFVIVVQSDSFERSETGCGSISG